MNIAEEISKLELACKLFYESNDLTLKAEAERTLVAFQNSPNNLGKCRILLDRGASGYSQLLATLTIGKLVSLDPQVLTIKDRVEIWKYVVNYLKERPGLQDFVVQGLVRLVAKITKVGWFDMYDGGYIFRIFLDEIIHSLDNCLEFRLISIKILSEITSEMGESIINGPPGIIYSHRKTASSFREASLYEIFLSACTTLCKAREISKDCNKNTQYNLVNEVLKLAQNCVTFDVGNTSNVLSDQSYIIDTIHNNKSIFLLHDDTLLEILFDLFNYFENTTNSSILSCLAEIVSVERAYFANKTKRREFMQKVINGIKNILQKTEILENPQNYFEFCRLISRFVSNCKIDELVMLDSYPEFIHLLAQLTLQKLLNWQFSANSFHYLLSFWRTMVTHYENSCRLLLFDNYIHKIIETYITSRLQSIAIIVHGGFENPFEDKELINPHLNFMFRYQYDKTLLLLVKVFDVSIKNYQELLANPGQQQEMAVEEECLAWIVSLIRSAISNDLEDERDRLLICKVFQLIKLTELQLSKDGCEKLESTLLIFLEKFTVIYDIARYERCLKLSKELGLNDKASLLNYIMHKIIINLRCWEKNEKIINQTLGVLHKICNGFKFLRILITLESVQFLLKFHTNEYFKFLANPKMYSRSLYYKSLGRLLMADLDEDECRFYNFMSPFQDIFEKLGGLFNEVQLSTFSIHEIKEAVIGLARDLGGLTLAIDKNKHYLMLFNWIYPNYTYILIKAVDIFYEDPEVTTPILLFFAELLQNRMNRIQFPASSADGVLLFKEASKIICCYGSRVIEMNVPQNKEYPLKLRGISICFTILKEALSARYINFSIFKLYGDEDLNATFNMFIKLLKSVPQIDLYQYPTLFRKYFELLSCLTQYHMNLFTAVETEIILRILSSISEGLTSMDSKLFSACCETLKYLVSYLFKELTPKSKRGINLGIGSSSFLQIYKTHPGIFQQFLTALLNTIIFEHRLSFTISDSLLVLILLNVQHFNDIKESIIKSQIPEKQNAMKEWFEKLMKGIEQNMGKANMEKFEENLFSITKQITVKRNRF